MHPAVHTSPYRSSIELQKRPAVTQPVVPGIFNVSPVNGPPYGEQMFGYYSTQPANVPINTKPTISTEDLANVPRQTENSTFLLTLSPHQVQQVAQNEEMQMSRGSDFMYSKIDESVKRLMKNIADRCDQISGNIDKIIKEQIKPDFINIQ